MRAVCLCAATLLTSCICAEPAALHSFAASANVLTVESAALDAAKTVLERAVQQVDPVAVAAAIKQLEDLNACIPVLPYLNILRRFVSQEYLAKHHVGAFLCGIAACVCWAIAVDTLLGRRGVDGEIVLAQGGNVYRLTNWCQETAEITGPHAGRKTMLFGGYLPWQQQLPVAGLWAMAGTAAGALGLRLARNNFDETRAREIVTRLLSSKALVRDADEAKAAAALRPLGIILAGPSVKNAEGVR